MPPAAKYAANPEAHPEAAGQGVAWPARAGIVPPLAEGFTVRADSVPGVQALLVAGAVVALVPGEQAGGDPGGWARSCGKTQIASYLAGALWEEGGVDLVAWVTAADRASVLSGYAEAAERLGLDDGGDAGQAADRLLGWLGSTARPWLVVLDDVRDAADLAGLLPGGPAGRVLVTAADAAAVPGLRQVTVPAFSLREAMTYLFGRLAASQDHRNGAYDLAEHLGGEPAALAQAGAVMAASGTSCPGYQRYFTEHRERLRAADRREPPAAAVTWMLSAEYAEELLPGGGTWPLLVLAALLDSHGIPLPVLTGPAACRYLADTGTPSPGQKHAQSAVLALEQAGLVRAGPAVHMDRALQQAARATAPAELRGQAARAAADAVLEAWPPDQPHSSLAAQLRACAMSLLRHAGDALWDRGGCHRVLLAAGQSLAAARLTGPALAWWQEVYARCERLLGSGHPDTLVAAGQLADALLAAGQHAAAAQWAQWVADGRDRVLGPDHPAAIAARISLGRALAGSGETNEALQVLRGAAARSEKAHGRGPQALAVADEYAAAFLMAGDTVTALRFGERALAGYEQAHGPADPTTLAAALRLADICLACGKVKDAIRQYRRVLTAREQALGPDHPGTLEARAGLATAYDTAGQIGDALREHQLACTGYERAEQALSPGDPVTRQLKQALDGITAELAGA